MNLIYTILFGFIGASTGSFFATLHHRDKNNIPILLLRSFCPVCQKKLKWYHLIPIISYIALRGKCAYCSSKIPLYYFIYEISFFLLYIFFWEYKDFYEKNLFIFYILFFSILLFLSLYDIYEMELYTHWKILFLIILIYKIIFFSSHIINSIIGGIVFFIPLWLIKTFYPKGLGDGDIWTATLIGFSLGFYKTIYAIFFSFLISGLFGISIIIFLKTSRKKTIPFIPFLFIGSLISISPFPLPNIIYFPL